ncbi:MAG: hypothetical protein ACI9GW_001841 [Halieaceae bacterium]|jgi:hypothetical protein
MDRIEKLKNDIYSFAELDTLEKNATQLSDKETLGLIAISRASKTAKGEKPIEKPTKGNDGEKTSSPKSRRSRRGESI